MLSDDNLHNFVKKEILSPIPSPRNSIEYKHRRIIKTIRGIEFESVSRRRNTQSKKKIHSKIDRSTYRLSSIYINVLNQSSTGSHISSSRLSSIINIYNSYVPPILVFTFRAKNRPKSKSNLEKYLSIWRYEESQFFVTKRMGGENAGKREIVSRKEEEESSQRAPRTERVSSLAQGQALLLERERSNISGVGERKKRG